MARTAQSAAPENPASAPSPAEAAGTAAAETHTGGSTRACPTRIDGDAPLFQHRVTVPQCMAKQRKLYHKCFTCAHLMGRS